MHPIPPIAIQAFCETEDVARAIERAGKDRRMLRTHLRVHMGGIETATEFYRTAQTPNLIILESRRERRHLLGSLNRLASVCHPDCKVVVLGHANDVTLYRELLRFGVSDYVVAPLSVTDIIGVIASIFIDADAAPVGRSAAFLGAKGGVGSSTIAHNIAWAASRLLRSEVVVADLDLAFGTANINFDRDPAQGIAEAIFAAERIDAVYLDRLLAQCAEHLSLLASPSSLERLYDLRPDAFGQLIDLTQRNAPFLVLDLPHQWCGWTRNTLIQADEVVITATPELASLRNTKNLVDMLKRIRPNDTLPKLVVNQAGVPGRPEISIADFAEPLGILPVAVIPFNPSLFGNASNSGRMLGEMDAHHPIVHEIDEIACILTGRGRIRTKRKKRPMESLLEQLQAFGRKSRSG